MKLDEICRLSDAVLARDHLALLWSSWRSNSMRYSDSIIDEVRATRDAIAKEHDYDIDKLAEALKAREANSGRKVVRLPPREVTLVRKAS